MFTTVVPIAKIYRNAAGLHTIVLGRPSRIYAELFARIPTLVDQIFVIAHNAKAFDLHFILNKAIKKWQVELTMKERKIMCTWLDPKLSGMAL